MISVGKDDSLMDIVLKINHCQEDEIILEFSFGHPILHNYLSLKILKNKAEPKPLTIITSDISSKKIGKKLGIQYSIIKDPNFIQQKNILQHNFSFGEYLRYELKNYYQELSSLIKQNKQVNSLLKYRYQSHHNNKGVSIFITAFFVSLIMLVFIFYFAVHKTYVYITPEIKIETRSANFVFSTQQNESVFDSENTIRLQQHTGSIQLEKSFGTTGISESSIQKSSGSAILFNHLDTPIDLKIHTRVQNEAGIVYTLRDAYRLAAASHNANGQIVASETPVDIIAKNYDIYGSFIGSRGNIGGDVSLILPGLPEHLQSKIYAKTAGDISGGTDTYTTTLEAEDIKKAKGILENQLRSELMKQMKKDITNDNTLNNTSNEILTLHEMIQYGTADIRISDGKKIGDEISEFNLIGNMDITLYTFDKQLIVNKLKKVVSDTIFEESEALLLIDKDSLRISHVLSTQKNQSEIKATSEVEILVQYNFLNSEDSFVHKLKHTIASMEIGTAESMLRNNEKIQDVEIKNRPFFMGEITHIPRNIIFRIQED